MKLSRVIVRLRVPIVILALILMVPSLLGMLNTRVNYDMLTYLPDSMDTVKGQKILLDEFDKGAFSFIILGDMPDKDVARQGLQRLQYRPQHHHGGVLQHLHLVRRNDGRNP